MATGDARDILTRLKAVLPGDWFPLTSTGQPSASPILDGVLSGPAWALSWAYSLIQYVQLQQRIATATDVFLDLAARDYFGGTLTRNGGETDAVFSARIQAALLPAAATRSAMIAAVTNLTGTAPGIFEPFNPLDTGAYSPTPGIGIGAIAAGSTTPVITTAVAPPITGCTVYQHTTPASGDSNAGYFFAPSAVIGETVKGTVELYIPASYAGGAITFQLEAGTFDIAGADMTAVNQWQTLTVSMTATMSGDQAFVVRGLGGGAGTNVFYTSAWGWRRSQSDPTFVATGLGYNAEGGYGSLALPAQAFITAYRQASGGIPFLSGYSAQATAPTYAPGGYGTGLIAYATLAQAATQVQDSEIYATVARTQAAGVTCWTRIENAPAYQGTTTTVTPEVPPTPGTGAWDPSWDSSFS